MSIEQFAPVIWGDTGSIAWIKSLATLMQQPEVTVRGMTTREVIGVRMTIQKPRHRYFLVPGRNGNVFSQIAEALWVLAGRNDLEFITRYIPQAPKFSDDGVTWRAGYGPRLRDWHGTDQIGNVVRLLKKDPHSRQAVISLWDPAEDWQESKDIPCNNWLHFLIRNNRLHLNVSVRSNDAWYGFSHADFFIWSLLQEYVAHWVGVELGQMNWFVGSYHIYDRHYDSAKEVIARDNPIELLSLSGVHPNEVRVPFDVFDVELGGFFSYEAMLRSSERLDEGEFIRMVREGPDITDPFIWNAIWMMLIYEMIRRGVSIETLNRAIRVLVADSLMRLAALEYVNRLEINRFPRSYYACLRQLRTGL